MQEKPDRVIWGHVKACKEETALLNLQRPSMNGLEVSFKVVPLTIPPPEVSLLWDPPPIL